MSQRRRIIHLDDSHEELAFDVSHDHGPSRSEFRLTVSRDEYHMPLGSVPPNRPPAHSACPFVRDARITRN